MCPLADPHSFMDDLESFFWVLFWICIHFTEPGKSRGTVEKFERWNYQDMEELSSLKLGLVSWESLFMKTMDEFCTPYHKPLIPLLNRLRKIVFPGDRAWKRESMKLYSKMRQALQDGQKDLGVVDVAP